MSITTKFLKRVIICLIIFLCILTLNIIAQENTNEFLSSESFEFYGRIGKTIYVPINVYNHIDNDNNSFVLTYDESEVELVDLTPYRYGQVLNANTISKDSNGNVLDTNVYRYIRFTKIKSGQIEFDITSDAKSLTGVIGVFKFKLKDTKVEFTLKRRNSSFNTTEDSELSVTASVASNSVVVYGNRMNASYEPVTLLVRDSESEIVHINQIETDVNGDYRYAFKLDATGLYTVYAYGRNLDNIVTTQFEIGDTVYPPGEISTNLDVIDGYVYLSGMASEMRDEDITMRVTDELGNTVYVWQMKTKTDGYFEHFFNMSGSDENQSYHFFICGKHILDFKLD